jgi:hypothetical protein
MGTTPRLLCGLMLLAAILLFAVDLHAGQSGKFDKLSEADRKAFGERFQKEIWPLLERGGKDGCVGCHLTKKGSLRMSGDPAKDFTLLLGEGYMLRKDPGSMLERILDKDKRRRMPPDDKAGWTEPEIQVLRQFVDDLDKKNKL